MLSDTEVDPSIEISSPDSPALRRHNGAPFMAYGFRSPSGKVVVAYWRAAHSVPGRVFPPLYLTLSLKNSGIKNPVVVDVVSGEIKPVRWKEDTTDTLEMLPIADSVMAVTDENYFDWPVLPEAPSGLKAELSPNEIKLSWELHGTGITKANVERRAGEGRTWTKIAEVPASRSGYVDASAPTNGPLAYRVRASNEAGESAYSNVLAVRR